MKYRVSITETFEVYADNEVEAQQTGEELHDMGVRPDTEDVDVEEIGE